MKYEDEIRIIATSNEDDPARFDISLNRPMDLDGTWTVALTEIVLPTKISYTDKDKDCVEIVKLRSGRGKRSTAPPTMQLNLSNYYSWFERLAILRGQTLDSLYQDIFTLDRAGSLLHEDLGVTEDLFRDMLRSMEHTIMRYESYKRRNISGELVSTRFSSSMERSRVGFVPRPSDGIENYVKIFLGSYTEELDALARRMSKRRETFVSAAYTALFENGLRNFCNRIGISTPQLMQTLDPVLTLWHKYREEHLVSGGFTEIPNLMLEHYFPWFGRLMAKTGKNQLEQREMLYTGRRELKTTEAARLLNVSWKDFEIMYRGLDNFIYKWLKLKNEEIICNMLPLNTTQEQMVKMGFVGRDLPTERVDDFLSELNEQDKILELDQLAKSRNSSRGETFREIYRAIFENRLKSFGVSPVRLLEMVDPLIELVHSHLDEPPVNDSLPPPVDMSNYFPWSTSLEIPLKLEDAEKVKVSAECFAFMKTGYESFCYRLSSAGNEDSLWPEDITLDFLSGIGFQGRRLPPMRVLEDFASDLNLEWIDTLTNLTKESRGRVLRRVYESVFKNRFREICDLLTWNTADGLVLIDPLLTRLHEYIAKNEWNEEEDCQYAEKTTGGFKIKTDDVDLLERAVKCLGLQTKIEYHKKTRKLTVKVGPNEEVRLHGRLSNVFSLPETMSADTTHSSSHCVDPYVDYRTLYVYFDFTREVLLGENFHPVLQTLPLETENLDKTQHTIFRAPLFLDLNKNHLVKLSVIVYNEIGEKLKFLTNTPSLIKLLFKKNGRG